MPQNSLTDLSAVKPRGPKIFVGLLGLVAIAGAAWFFFLRPPGPVGEPEDAAKVVLVGGDDEVAEFLEGVGFTLERVELADFEGAQAVLLHADERGFGYVAFSNPSEVEFGQLAVTPTSADIVAATRWAVFSVGSFAQPHHVTVAADDGLYVLPTYIDVLRALFGQVQLEATLVGENKLSMEAEPLFDKLKPAPKILGSYGLVDVKARKIARERRESIDESEEASPKAAVIADALERTFGFPLANGGMMLYSERPKLEAPRDEEVRLDYPGFVESFFLASADATKRERCDGPGGAAAFRTETFVSPSLDILLRAAGDVTEVWSMPASATGCPFKKLGTIGAATGALGSPNAKGQVLRSVDAADEQIVELWTPGEAQPQVWPMSGCTDAGRPHWIDDVHFVAACLYTPPAPDLFADPDAEPEPEPEPIPEPEPEQSWLYFVSSETGQVLAWRLNAEFGLPRIDHRPAKTVSVLVRGLVAKLHIVTGTVDVAALFATPPTDPEVSRPTFVAAEEQGVAVLAADAFEVRELAIDPTLQNLVVSPTGNHAAFEVDTDAFERWSTNVAVLDFASGKTKRLAINPWVAHRSPRFTADGTSIVFNSNYDADDRTMSALRLAPLR